MTVNDHNDPEGEDDSRASAGDDEETKSRKRKERLEQNRISARESRKRKKTMITQLQQSICLLSKENKDLNERNESLRRQLMEIGAKYPNIVPLQAIVGQGAALPEGMAPMAAAAAAAGGMAGFNPLNWMPTAGGNEGGANNNQGDQSQSGVDASANV